MKRKRQGKFPLYSSIENCKKAVSVSGINTSFPPGCRHSYNTNYGCYLYIKQTKAVNKTTIVFFSIVFICLRRFFAFYLRSNEREWCKRVQFVIREKIILDIQIQWNMWYGSNTIVEQKKIMVGFHVSIIVCMMMGIWTLTLTFIVQLV